MDSKRIEELTRALEQEIKWLREEGYAFPALYEAVLALLKQQTSI